jgi:hypothetical protein
MPESRGQTNYGLICLPFHIPIILVFNDKAGFLYAPASLENWFDSL